jgi:hypothetical protein
LSSRSRIQWLYSVKSRCNLPFIWCVHSKSNGRSDLKQKLCPYSFHWFSKISSHPAVFFSHNKPAKNIFQSQ